jgi:ketosteroid isomerase-like protein
MRFEICETVQTTDQEMVLRALEQCSREVSSEVVRDGDRIMLHGLGPSPRAKNVHDTTVFCVNAEDDKTIINGEVSFQASALLGDQPQGDVVRSKLDELFIQMKAQIELVSRRGAVRAMAAASNGGASLAKAVAERSAVTTDVLVEECAVTAAEVTVPRALNGTPESGLVDAAQGVRSKLAAYLESIAEPVQTVEFERTIGSERSVESRQNFEQKQNVWLTDLQEIIDSDLHARTVLEVEEFPTTIEEEELPTTAEELQTTPADVEELRDATEDEEAPPRKRLAVWVTGLVVLLLVAAGSYSLYRPRTNSVVPSVQTIQQQAPAIEQPVQIIVQPAAVPTNPLPTSEPSHLADAKPLLPPTQSEIVNPAVQVADVNVWLANWAAAMRTRDASAQAAFYADTVDRYVGKYDVNRDVVRRDREATIRMRKGLWTMKMEKVVIDRQTTSEAEVRLVKHFIDEPVPSEIMESFVATRLTLKRTDGGWRITSEQDLPASSAALQTR